MSRLLGTKPFGICLPTVGNRRYAASGDWMACAAGSLDILSGATKLPDRRFAVFEERFQPLEVRTNLLRRLFTKEPCDPRSQPACGRLVLKVNDDLCAKAGRGHESHGPGSRDVGILG